MEVAVFSDVEQTAFWAPLVHCTVRRFDFLAKDDLMEHLKYVLAEVPFTDKDRVIEVLENEGVSKIYYVMYDFFMLKHL